MGTISQNTNMFSRAVKLLHSARQQVVKQVNLTMVKTYFEIGQMIVEEEQQGKDRAEYGTGLLKGLSKTLSTEFGKGFSIRNIEPMRKFYLTYSITQTLSADSENKTQTPSANFNLSWSHYLKLMRIEEENERKFYEIESAN